MSANKIIKALSSFNIKLFFWFWLVALISIFGTRYISQQILFNSNAAITAKSVHTGDLKQLTRLERVIRQAKVKSIDALFSLPIERHTKYNIWLKKVNDSNIESYQPVPDKPMRAIKNYILSNGNNVAIETTLFAHTRLTGPINVSLNKTDYQIYVSKKAPRGHFRKFVQRLPRWAAIIIPLSISFFLCWLLARSISKPIAKIKQATTSIAKGELSTRVTGLEKRNDELGELAASFNQMTSKLEQNVGAQQRLLGDVSHELRSPLTRLQMALALAQQAESDNKVRDGYFERCQLEISRLDQMIADVLALSRMENTVQTLQIENFNLVALINNIIADEQFIANQKRIKLRLHAPKNINISADSGLLSSAISNLLSNAIKYSDEDSTIDIKLVANKDTVLISVSDSGCGVPQESIEQLFNAFYRVNEARDRNTGGIGLGLAIAKQAIIAHQGKIYAKNNLDPQSNVTGLTVTIELPLKAI
ncbi:ATP-binding protein [Litorilituus sediminis]|uniref:histidine kinase n=1 Tax=Litorilituus sediminis TaxID=718192 RepID=A0A4P6PAI4_9GAMM|nr:ATP-binding protein [Litorilituus sediminis]QBG36652.1 HAMP domain-containing protein [Litorilituus sediminis]